jgi:FkbM family methyltransferase
MKIFLNVAVKEKITLYYRKYLEREPDPGGLMCYWNAILNKEISIEDLPQILTNSDEFKQLQRNKQKLQFKDNTIIFNNREKKVLWRLIDGHKICFDASDDVLINNFALDDFYEKQTLDLLNKIVKKGMTVVNIGANVGYIALHLARLVGSSGRVIAFEASSETAFLLEHNAKENHYKNIEVYANAISDKSDKATMLVGTSSAHNVISPKGIDCEGKKIIVDVTSLDDFFNGKNISIDLIFMDAEGSEKFILEGMQRILEENPKLEIITEYNPFALDLVHTSGREFLDKIERLEFTMYLIDEEKAKTHHVDKDVILESVKYPYVANLYLKREK